MLPESGSLDRILNETNQVEGVSLTKAGQSTTGTLHLTTHHIIFHYDDENTQEMWVSFLLGAVSG
jgi:hypothetical protein